MDKSLIKKLIDAGVSADVVLKLHLEEEDPAPKAEDPQPEPKAADPQPEPKPQAAAAGGMDQVLAAIQQLTGAIQAGNIGRDSYEHKEETADQVIATILKGGSGDGKET